MRAALGVVMLVACSDVHGVAVLVHPNSPDVRYVRLFVGTGGSVMADLTPDSGITAANALYTVRNAGNDCDTCDVIAVTSDVVKFGFVTEDAIPVVIAVGYDAQKQPIVAGLAHDLAPSDQSNDFFGYELDLAPFAAFSQTSTTSLQLDLWSTPDVAKDPFAAQCAGIIDPNADHPYFVIRAEDQDCDGLPDGSAGECTPDYYLGTAPPDAADATCLVGETAKCRLGGKGCVDDGGTAPACSPSETCLPTNLCGECTDVACAAQISSDIAMATAHYSCTVNLATDGTVCPTAIPLDRPPSGGYDCTGVQIADAATQLTDKITQSNVDITVAEDIDAATSCSATLAFAGKPTDDLTVSAMVAFKLKNNAGIAMPVTIQFEPGGCTNQAPCALDTRAFDDPTQAACATAWTGPSTAVALPPTSTTDAQDPSLTPDQKQMFYESGGTIYQVTKSNNAWMTPTVAAVTTNGANHAPELSADGLSLVVVSTDIAMVTNLYVSTRGNLMAAFGAADPIANADDTLVFTAATFAPDDATGGHHMIAAGVVAGNQHGLYDLTLDPTGHTITEVTGIPLYIMNPDHPHLSPDGLHLYVDGVSNGTTSLYVASRRTIAESFGEAVRLVELDDPQDPTSQTSGAWVSSGARTMYYTHADNGVKHIYQTTRVTF